MTSEGRSPRWLLLIHQLPAEPSRLRVKTWRRLMGAGAVLVKNSVYVLPNHPERREDFDWIRTEIVADGGEALVFTADTVDDITDREVVEAFTAARRNDWKELRLLAEGLSSQSAAPPEARGREQLQKDLRALEHRAAQIGKIDFFPSSERQETMDALKAAGRLLGGEKTDTAAQGGSHQAAQFRGRRWLTRPRPGVDRMASAWLIRRYIDPGASFIFADRIPADEDVVPFDMFGVEFGHQGELCTFETLLRCFDLRDPVLQRLAGIVHHLDLPGGAPPDPETATVGALIEGLREAFPEDQELLEQGVILFEALHRSLRGRPGSAEGGSSAGG